MYLLCLLGYCKSMSTTCLHSYISIYSELILFTDSKHELHSIDSSYKLQIQSKRLVTILVSYHTKTGLCCLTIQVLNIRACFIDIWSTFLIYVYNNLEHELAIIAESFSPLNLNYTTSFVKDQTRSDATSHDIPICHVH